MCREGPRLCTVGHGCQVMYLSPLLVAFSSAPRRACTGMNARSAAALCNNSKDGARCRFGEWNLKDVDFLNQVQLITAKPVVYLVNLPEKMYIKKKSKWLPKVPACCCFPPN